MNLGAFSLSLTVKNIKVSREFYEKLGFKKVGGDISQNWLILKNDDCIIGLFQGLFKKNILTFNPGWDKNSKKLDSFIDIRILQREFKEQGLNIENEIEENTAGPASFVLNDPDGNPILFDQHI